MVKKRKANSLSLENLTLFDITIEEHMKQKQEAELTIKQYKEKYGEDYIEHLFQDEGLMKLANHTKDINTAIYQRRWLEVSGNTEWARTCKQRQVQRMRELFGQNMDIMTVFSNPNINIEKILLNDVMHTGKWDDFPDKLKEKYHKLVGKRNEGL